MNNLDLDISTQKYPVYEEQIPDISKLLDDPFEALGIQQFSQIVYNLSLNLDALLRDEGIFLTKLIQGRGSFGQVYQAPSLATVEMGKYAGKFFKLEHQYNIPNILNEFQIQYELNKLHPEKYLYFKPPILLHQAYPNHLYNILATLEQGKCNLYQYLQQNDLDISDCEYLGIFYQVLDSVVAMHKHHYAHRDIKPQNIIYVEKKGWILSDFGCAQKYEQIEDEYEIAGTKAFNYEEIRNQINKQQQSVKINLLKNDLYAFCQTMIMVKYPKQTIIECQQMIKNKQSEISQLNQILNLLDDNSLLIKAEQLLPLQYEKVNPKFDSKFLQSLIVFDKEILPDETDDWDYLTGRGIERLKQKIYINLCLKGAIPGDKNFKLILTEPLSEEEQDFIPAYLIKAEQYTKLKQILPKCYKMGEIHLKFYELFVNINLNNYVEAFDVCNQIEQSVNKLTFIDKAVFYLFKNYLILEQKGEKWIDVAEVYNYIVKSFKGQTNIFVDQIILRYFYFLVKQGASIDLTLENIINIFETTQISAEQNQFCYIKSKCYYQKKQYDKALSTISIFFERQNPKNLNVKEFVDYLLKEDTDPVVIQRIIYQMADCYLMLHNYSLCCQYLEELISFCKVNSLKLQYEYYINYAISLTKLLQYDKALHVLKLASFMDCDKIQKLMSIWLEASIYFYQGQLEQSKSRILSLFEVFQNFEFRPAYLHSILFYITTYLEELVRSQSIEFAKSLFEMTQNLYINNYGNYFHQNELCNFFSLGVKIYVFLHDNQHAILTLKKLGKIVKFSNPVLYQQNKIFTWKINIFGNTLIQGNQLENNQKVAYYYQKYINFLKSQPIDEEIVNVYKKFINFYQQINHPGVLNIVESYAAFMIENFDFQDRNTQEAIAMLEIYQ